MCNLQSFSECALIWSEREWRYKIQGRARARAHPKTVERRPKKALIFALKIIQFFRKLLNENSNKISYYIFPRIYLNLSLFLLRI